MARPVPFGWSDHDRLEDHDPPSAVETVARETDTNGTTVPVCAVAERHCPDIFHKQHPGKSNVFFHLA